MTFTVLIPARLASLRLPNKPLADIAGVPMVVRVAQQALRSGAQRVVVAGDSFEIVAACQAHGIEAVLTRTDHPSGSDRLAEACDLLGLPDDTIVVNVQGDEPLMDPELVTDVAHLLIRRPQAAMSTAAHAIDSVTDFHNPNVVKVVLDGTGHALYFSRAPIPYPRDSFALNQSAFPAGLPSYRHIGIYAYRARFLQLYNRLEPAAIEGFEALEQLRALWHGHRIAVAVTAHAPQAGVDTDEDLARVRGIYAAQRHSD